MAATGLGYGLIQTGISLGTTFNALASAGVATTAALTFPLVTNATAASVALADLELVLSAGITSGSGTPFLAGVFDVADSSTNYSGFVGVVSSQLFPINFTSFIWQAPASTALGTVIRVPGIVLPAVLSTSAANPKLTLFNNLGVAFPATVTGNLYPYGYDAG